MHKKILDVPIKDLTENDILELLAKTDNFMARVSEDTILALLRGGVIQPRDLPDKAREVLEARSELRELLDKRRKEN